MDISEYIKEVCEMFDIDIVYVNKKLNLKDTLELAHSTITTDLLDNAYESDLKQYTERDMKIAQLNVIRVIMSICKNRGRF